VSRDFSIRSAAQATSSALDRIPIRWRLAGGSALLTLVILCTFAMAVGALTSEQIRDDFRQETDEAADQLRERITPRAIDYGGYVKIRFGVNLDTFVQADNAAARIIDINTGQVVARSKDAPDLGPVLQDSLEWKGRQVETRLFSAFSGRFAVQYGRPQADVKASVRQVRLFLVGGVVGGAALALLAGLMMARRAMRPIARLSETAREIERTRDPSQQVDVPPADDEVAELARTLDGMLQGLSAARCEQQAMLLRQREFVADASHELRTPLTSVLANLDFLAETLEGEQGDAARSALRSSQRMGRLVQDLLLLARADAQRAAPHEPLDVGQVLVEAAAELEPVTGEHALTIEVGHAMVDGSRDELHRLLLNLMENAVKHTPEGTHIRAGVARENGHVRVSVEDDGPGIPSELRDKVFERFVRGSGDRGGSFGLGLSIVRAVAENHGGTVSLAAAEHGHGTRFVVTLPGAR
jgi:signal transduction histidine kinase